MAKNKKVSLSKEEQEKLYEEHWKSYNCGICRISNFDKNADKRCEIHNVRGKEEEWQKIIKFMHCPIKDKLTN